MSVKSLTFKTLPYQPDALIQQFAPLAHQTWAMLLHSGFAEHTHNRFDILVADPRVTLTTRGEQTEIISAQGQEFSSEDPFSLLQQQLDQFLRPRSPHPDLPFLGGALGLFGYDLGRRVEVLPALAEQDITLPDMAVGLYDWALIADHHCKN